MTKDQLLEKANSLPLAPGVYLMHDKDGAVIYVGKAKKLKNRVSQYFQAGRGHNLKTQTMVSLVDTFDTIIVGSEFEALVLENALIKQYMPRYNILLKDSKGYPYIRLSNEAYPRFSLASRASAASLLISPASYICSICSRVRKASSNRFSSHKTTCSFSCVSSPSSLSISPL